MKCPNKNNPDWIELVDKIGIREAYREYIKNNYDVPNPSKYENTFSGVNATLKLITALENIPRNDYPSNQIQGFYNDLVKQGTPKNQIDLLKEFISDKKIEKINKVDLISSLLAEIGYTIEINTAKENIAPEDYQENEIKYWQDKIDNAKEFYSIYEKNEKFEIVTRDYDINNKKSWGIRFVVGSTKYSKKEDAEEVMKSIIERDIEDNKAKIKELENFENDLLPTQYYSNLTVPGGTNYTENEIKTPNITPSIKGHAKFSTNNGIGWFRSDEQVTNGKYIDTYNNDLEFDDEGTPILTPEGERKTINGNLTKTRRILEVQSDLFQKGRDRNILTNEAIENTDFYQNDGDERGWYTNTPLEERKEKVNKGLKENKFLQLLNKDNNWVTFFVKSIIQDSAKKGYEKILFPLGDTVSKVEGHQSLEEFKRNRIKAISDRESQIENEKRQLEEVNKNQLPKEFLNTNWSIEDIKKTLPKTIDTHNREIKQYKEELKRIEKEGFAALRPIYKFYEETVGNILKKQGFNLTVITDEYNNKWYEIEIKPNHKTDTITFKVSDIKAKVLIDLPQAEKWIKDKLGDKIQVLQFSDVNNILKNLENNGETWGYYSNKVIGLSTKAEKGTEYHEAFHRVFRSLLTDEEITNLYRLAQSKFGNPTNTQLRELKESSNSYNHLNDKQLRALWLEEKLADKFQDYIKKKEQLKSWGIIGKIFEKIKELINFITKNNTELEAFFGKINNGSFKNSDVISNRFSGITSLDPIFKIIPKGEEIIKGTEDKKFTYSSVEEGRQVIRDITAETVEALQNNKFKDLSQEEIVDKVIEQKKIFNDINNNKDLLNSIPTTERLKAINKLRELQFMYSNPTSLKIIKDQVEKELASFEFTPEELDLDEQITNEENERKAIDFDKNAINIGGFDSLNKEIRRYIGTTLYDSKDLLGRDIRTSVNPQVVYQGIERVLSSTQPDNMMSKLKVFSEDNLQTKAVYDRLVEDTQYDEVLGKPLKNSTLLQRFLNSFTKEKLDYLQILVNPESGKTQIFNANQKDAKHLQFSNWLRNWNNLTSEEQFSDKNINTLEEAKVNLQHGEISDIPQIKKAFNNIGIELSDAFIKFSIFKNQEINNDLVNNYSDTSSLSTEDTQEIINILQKKNSPFEKTKTETEQGEFIEEDTAAIGRLLNIADSNSQFDENILSSNFQDSEGKTRWSYITPSLTLERTRELQEQLSTKEGRGQFKEDMKKEYSHDYSFNNNNYLVNHENADLLFNKDFKVQFTGDIRSSEKGEEGSTFKNLDDRGFKLMQLGLFSDRSTRKGDNNQLTVAKYYPKVLEASASAYSIELPVEEFSTKEGKANQKSIEALYKQFLQEVERISITQKEIENYNLPKIKNYHLGKQNGLKLFYFRYLENVPELGEKIIEKAKTYNSREDFNDLEKDIKTQIEKSVNDELSKEFELLDNLGIYNKDQNLLPEKFKENPKKFIGDFFLNTLININAFNDLIELNPAFSKDSNDNVKRSKRWIASKVNFGKGQHVVGFIEEPTAQGITKKIDIADAQAYIDLNHFKFILYREGKLSNEVNNILNKIDNGDKLTWEEVTILKDKQVMLNSIKTVTSGPVDYHKMSDLILTKNLTSIKDKDGNWIANPDTIYLHNLRLKLGELSKKHSTNYSDNYQPKDLDNLVPARIFPESASKLLSYQPAKLEDNNYNFTDFNTRLIDNKYSGRQVDTPSGKTEIVYGTQLLQLIDSEQDDNEKVVFNDVETTIGNLRRIYQKLLSQARTNSVDKAKKFLGKLVDGKLTEKEETRFRKKLLSSLEESGADDSLLQFFGLDPMYNLNLPNTINKYEQLFLAHFSKNVLSQKIAGLKLTLVSGHGYLVNGKELQYNPEGLSEAVLPAFTRELHDLKEGDILKAEQVLEMFGQRIPTQDKHSMIAFKVVEFLPSEYGSIGIFPKEVIELSGADFDIDSLFVERKDFYVNSKGKFIPFGSAKDINGKFNEFKISEQQNNKDLKKLIKLRELNGDSKEIALTDSLKELQLPSNLEEFTKELIKNPYGINNSEINNKLVDINIKFLINKKMNKEKIPQTPATTSRLAEVRDNILELQGKPKNNQFTLNSPFGQFTSWKSNSTGKENVGPAANTNLIRAFLYKADIHLKTDTFRPSINGNKFFDFSKNKSKDGNRIQDTLSTILSAMTDNAKDPMAGDLNLTLTSLGPALQLVSLGINLETAMLIINQPVVKEYVRQVEQLKTTIRTQEDKKVFKSKLAENLIDKYKLKSSDDLNLVTNELREEIKNNKITENQGIVLQVFLKLEEQGRYWQHLSKLLALNKGLPSSFKDTRAVTDAIEAFKLNSNEELAKEVPFDIRKAIKDTHIENNIKLFKDIMNISKLYFITNTDLFNKVIEDIENNIKPNIKDKKGVLNSIKMDFLSYLTINIYYSKLNKIAPQELLVGKDNIINQLAKINKNSEFKNNKLIKFLSIDKSKNLPILIANTRIKLSSTQLEELTESFRELFNNPESNQFARNLFDYLIVKDNLQFRNDSFIKFISPFMFIEVSKTLDNINDALSKNEKLDVSEEDFKDIWFRYKENQQYLQKFKEFNQLLDLKDIPNYAIKYGEEKGLYKYNGKGFDKLNTIGDEIQKPYSVKTVEEVINNSKSLTNKEIISNLAKEENVTSDKGNSIDYIKNEGIRQLEVGEFDSIIEEKQLNREELLQEFKDAKTNEDLAKILKKIC